MDPVDIANLGLGWIGKGPIASLDSAAQPAPRVKAAFAGLRDAVLEERDWTFAMERLQLDKDGAAPAFGYTARYVVPARVLRITRAEDPGSASIDAFAAAMSPVDEGLDWVKEGPHVCANTDAAKLNVLAIVQVEDPARWSPGFCQALAARLAAELCIPLTENRALAVQMWELYAVKLRDAAANDGRQGRNPVRRVRTLFARRR